VSIAQQNIGQAEANLERTMASVKQKRENR